MLLNTNTRCMLCTTASTSTLHRLAATCEPTTMTNNVRDACSMHRNTNCPAAPPQVGASCHTRQPPPRAPPSCNVPQCNSTTTANATVALPASLSGLLHLLGFPWIADATRALLRLAAAAASLLLALLAPRRTERAPLTPLHAALLNVTHDAGRAADLMHEFISLEADPALQQRLLSFLALKAATSYSRVEQRLSWVLWVYSTLWMPLLVVLCLSRGSRRRRPSTSVGAQDAPAALPLGHQQREASAASRGGGLTKGQYGNLQGPSATAGGQAEGVRQLQRAASLPVRRPVRGPGLDVDGVAAAGAAASGEAAASGAAVSGVGPRLRRSATVGPSLRRSLSSRSDSGGDGGGGGSRLRTAGFGGLGDSGSGGWEGRDVVPAAVDQGRWLQPDGWTGLGDSSVKVAAAARSSGLHPVREHE